MKNTQDEVIVVENLSSDQVPNLINEQFTKLEVVKNNVERATSKARKAQQRAEEAKNISPGLFHRKEAIEELQTVTEEIADAQIASAEAQEVSFEYQQKLGEITKYLFSLGVSNIATNRSVVRQLQLKLRDASEKDLDELARQEIIGVVKQLKAQEDIMIKQSAMSDIVKRHDKRLNAGDAKDKEQDEEIGRQAEKDKEHDKRLDEGDAKDKEQDEEIARQAEKDKEQDQRLDAGDAKDKEQDEEIGRQAEKDKEHDKRLDAGDAKDKEQDEEIGRQAEKDKEHDKRLDAGDAKDKEQDQEIGRQAEKIKNLFEDNQLIKQRCTVQEEDIKKLQEKNMKLENSLREMDGSLRKMIDTKYNKLLGILTFVLSLGAFILSIVGVM